MLAKAQEMMVNVMGDLAYTVGYEHGTVVVDGAGPKPVTIRVTHSYRRESGAWFLVHRHGDFAPADQLADSQGMERP